ncbi:MAG: hypothetical protein MJE68_25230 [Proteobacteria bacterium]|nr:hypothetical protein [Pseudomonadota bacterium]
MMGPGFYRLVVVVKGTTLHMRSFVSFRGTLPGPAPAVLAAFEQQLEFEFHHL